MPTLGQRHFAYTPEGMAQYAAAKAAKNPGGPPSDDKAERDMGAYDFVKKNSTGFKIDPREHKTLKDAQMSLADIISEGDVADYYPDAVWVRASNKLVAQMWAMHKKSMMAKTPKKR
jgi:hypothetical protein